MLPVRPPITRGVSGGNLLPSNASTRYCAVFGDPVQHSASPAMQNAGLDALGLNWRYLACRVPLQELHEAIRGARAMRFIGLNLTVPHKLKAMTMVDVLSQSAQQWGAINTIRFEGRMDERWLPLGELGETEPEAVRSQGFNTDADALVLALQEDLALELPGRSVLVLGAGGAGQVAALRLAQEGVKKLFLVNRTESRAVELAERIQKKFPAVRTRVGYPAERVDVVVNATSAGLKPNDPLPFERREFSFAQASCAYDLIYRPAMTPFLQAARDAGLKTANGLGMLLHQGAAALTLWAGKSAPIAAMRAALQREVYGH